MKLQILLIIFLHGIIPESFGQSTFQEMYQHVLNQNKIDTPFSIDKSTKANGHNETILTYLGSVQLKDGRNFKILTYEYIWGPNFHTAGSIYIFNDRNQYVGQYHLGSAAQLPSKLKDRNLIFTNDDNENCDKDLVTEISLKNGLPKIIFIKCKGIYGDLYKFTSND